jgi:hypothetical protein
VRRRVWWGVGRVLTQRPVEKGEVPSPRRQPARKRTVSSVIDVADTGDESSGSGGRGRLATKKARSDTALGGPGPSRGRPARPRPTQARAVPQVVLQARRVPVMFDPIRDLQRLEEDIVAAFAVVRARWEEMARANAAQAHGKGKGKEA